MNTGAGREDWDGNDVGVGEVLDRLAAQRRPPGGGMPFTLSGVVNLVAYAADPSELRAIQEIVDALADRHPSRAVILCAGDGEGDGIDATVSTSCRLTGDQAGVAVETVTLTLRGEAVGGAASAAVPLLRPDLPTVLWWPGPPVSGDDGPLAPLAAIVDRVVTEAGRVPGGVGVRALASWAPAAGPAVTDLAWAAITSWRQLVAQMIDGDPLRSLREGPSIATLCHSTPQPDAGTLLLAGWLADLVGPTLRLRLAARPGGSEGPVAVDLEGTLSGRRLAVEHIAGRAAAAVCVTEADGAARRRVLPLPEADRARLLAGELELQRRDHAFERALPRAAAVAT